MMRTIIGTATCRDADNPVPGTTGWNLTAGRSYRVLRCILTCPTLSDREFLLFVASMNKELRDMATERGMAHLAVTLSTAAQASAALLGKLPQRR